jgi:hypothetical protein
MSRVLKFFAKDHGVYTDHAICVGFSRDQADEESDEALILQRAFESEDDNDEICLEIPIQRCISYGGVKRAELKRNSFEIIFEPEAMRDLNDIEAMLISFSMPDEAFEQITNALQQVFRGHEAFVVST